VKARPLGSSNSARRLTAESFLPPFDDPIDALPSDGTAALALRAGHGFGGISGAIPKVAFTDWVMF